MSAKNTCRQRNVLHPETRMQFIEELQQAHEFLLDLSDTPSPECVFWRTFQESRQLQLDGYSEFVACAAADAAGQIALEAVENGMACAVNNRAAWFRAIARQYAEWFSHRELWYQSLELPDLLPCPVDDISPEDVVEMVDDISNALRTLPAQEREAIVDHFLLRLGFEAVGEKLGVAPSTAWRRVQDGLNRLRDMLMPTWKLRLEG